MPDTYDPMTVLITADENGHLIQFSGTMISPDEVITASHGVEHWDINNTDPNFTPLPVPNTNIQVVQNPADPNALDPQPAAIGAAGTHYNLTSTTPYGLQGNDFAVIKLAHPVTPGTGFMVIDPSYVGGTANFSGYPATFDANGHYTGSPLLDAQTNTFQMINGVNDPQEVLGGTVPFQPGASGGSVWIQGPNGPELVGIEDGIYGGNTGVIAGLNYNAMAEINYWQAQDGESPAIVRLYNSLLSRAPDTAGLEAWSALVTADTIVTGLPGLVGTTYESATGVLQSNPAIVDGFLNSPEFIKAHPNLTDDALVTLLYDGALHRAPDPAGFAGWVGSLENHALTPEQVVIGIVLSPEALQHAPIYT